MLFVVKYKIKWRALKKVYNKKKNRKTIESTN